MKELAEVVFEALLTVVIAIISVVWFVLKAASTIFVMLVVGEIIRSQLEAIGYPMPNAAAIVGMCFIAALGLLMFKNKT